MKKSRRPDSDIQRVLGSLASPIRLGILKSLAYQKLGYSELAKAVGMNRDRDAGKFSYHLKRLLESGLIEADAGSGKYVLSRKGAAVLRYLEKLEEEVGGGTFMMVRRSDQTLEPFDKNKIAEALVKEAKLPPRLAREVASVAERKLYDLKIDYLTAPLIRELVNSILLDMGLEKYRHKLTRIGMPLHDAEILFKKTVNAGDWRIFVDGSVGSIEKEYLLLGLLPRKIAEMHLHGEIDIHPTAGWLTMLLSRLVDLNARDELKSAIQLASSILYIRCEVLLKGSPTSIRRFARALLGDAISKPLISFRADEAVLNLVEELCRGARREVGMLLDIRNQSIQELARISRRLSRLGVSYGFTLSDGICFSGYRLDDELQAIHSIVSLNVFDAMMRSGGDQEELVARLKERVKLVLPLLRKGIRIASKLHPDATVYSLISLGGVLEASKFLARSSSSVIEEASEIEVKIIEAVSRLISQEGDGRIMLSGRCPETAVRRFFQLDSYRYGDEALRNLANPDSRSYADTPIPDPGAFRSWDEWIEAVKKIVRPLSGGFRISVKANKLSKALSEAAYIAENLYKANRRGVISISLPG